MVGGTVSADDVHEGIATERGQRHSPETKETMMSTGEQSSVIEAMRRKRGVRASTPDSVPEATIEAILHAGRRAQHSKNAQPWTFIMVTDHEHLRRRSTVGIYAAHLASAAFAVGVVAPSGTAFDPEQAAASMQLTATAYGIGSCSTTLNDTAAHTILGVPDQLNCRWSIAYGYPAEASTPLKVGGRKPLGEVILWCTEFRSSLDHPMPLLREAGGRSMMTGYGQARSLPVLTIATTLVSPKNVWPGFDTTNSWKVRTHRFMLINMFMERKSCMQAWLASGLRRFYPSSPAETNRSLVVAAARGERCAVQAVCRTANQPQVIQAVVHTPEPLTVMLRRVGYVPMPHVTTELPLDDIEGGEYLPGFVPDPLLPEATIHAGPRETNAFWITIHIPPDARPGDYQISITLIADGENLPPLTVNLMVHHATLGPRRDFPVTHWFYADALCDWYHVELHQDAFWPVVEPYFSNLVAHGQDTIYVPVWTPPLDGVKRPTQLLGVSHDAGTYHFDWRLVRRWVHVARSHGLTSFEWPHLFTQWGAHHPPRIYAGHGETATMFWPPDSSATSPAYRSFLSQFLPEFERFLRAENLRDHSFFHLSDEPHGEAHLASYRAAREMLWELAPWMEVMDALTDLDFARAELTDIPIPLLTTAPAFMDAGFPAWAYFCCVPRGRYLNRFLDTPLVKVRMAGWLFYRNRARGFLHWGYNYWYKRQTTELINPYQISDALAWPGWSFGDPFVVYPGSSGPVDSIRWEVFAESLQDYALIQHAGMHPDDSMLGDIQDYATFPRDPAWIAERRQRVLAQLDSQS